VYGLDVGDDALLESRSWRWLRTRIVALLAANTRITRHFTPPPKKEVDDHGAEHR